MDLRYQWVTCIKCERFFQVTPDDDYYGATNNQDGMCEPCLLNGMPLMVIEIERLT